MGNVELHKSVLDLFVNEVNKVSSAVAKDKGLTVLDTHKKLEKEICIAYLLQKKGGD